MASFPQRAREDDAPRRRSRTLTPTPEDGDARRTQMTRGASFSTEAASTHEPYVPVAYPVAETVTEAQVMPPEPSAPACDGEVDVESGSWTSSERQAEDRSLFHDSSFRGDYSEYSLSTAHQDTDGGGRSVGTREWLQHQPSERSSRITAASSTENPWGGPGRDDSETPYTQGGRRGGKPALHDLPPHPMHEQASVRSGLSHDLEGFSDFDPVSREDGGHSRGGSFDPYGRGIRDAHPAASDPSRLARIGGTGAAAAAAAEATNAAAAAKAAEDVALRNSILKEQRGKAARAERQKRAAAVSEGRAGSGKVPPMPHGGKPSRRTSLAAGGEMKDEASLGGSESFSGRSSGRHGVDDSQGRRSAFGDAAREASRVHGDPYDNSPGVEYAVPTSHSVVFTPFIFLICGILLFWEFSLNNWSAEDLSSNPSYGPSSETLIEAGAKRTDLILDDGDWWRLISPMFLHAGVIHFLFNMLGFLQVGALVERVFGWWRVGSIYMVAGIFGTIVSAVFVPLQVMVGASGAIFGVFGALWADLWQNWSVYSDKCRTLTVLFFLTAINIVLGLMPYLDNFAHIGGMLMGFFMGLGVLVQKREDGFGRGLEKKCYQRTLQMVSAIAVPTLLILGLSLLYGRSDPTEWCGWCQNISCVEFPISDPWWLCDECSTAGFKAEKYSNGTISIVCPDSITRFSNECSSETDELLTACCIDLCL